MIGTTIWKAAEVLESLARKMKDFSWYLLMRDGKIQEQIDREALLKCNSE